eukprot:g372.t1
MAPELVQELPYNHTADLWSVGVILFELFVGTPPFYANSLYSLIHLIVKDTVSYPATMGGEFKDFLQGLLRKDPQQRLAWPGLLNHAFVAAGAEKERKQMEQEPMEKNLAKYLPSPAVDPSQS